MGGGLQVAYATLTCDFKAGRTYIATGEAGTVAVRFWIEDAETKERVSNQVYGAANAMPPSFPIVVPIYY